MSNKVHIPAITVHFGAFGCKSLLFGEHYWVGMILARKETRVSCTIGLTTYNTMC